MNLFAATLLIGSILGQSPAPTPAPTSSPEPTTTPVPTVTLPVPGPGAPLPDKADWSTQNEPPGGLTGEAISTAGDVNGDGFDDVLIASPGATAGARVQLHFGGAGGLSKLPRWGWTPAQPLYGLVRYTAVASAGDVNGDGYSDIIIGIRLYELPGVHGAAFVFLGGPRGPRPAPDWSFVDRRPFSSFGCGVASAGDVNGDGISDVMIATAPTLPGARAELFVFHGRPGRGLAAEPSCILSRMPGYGGFAASLSPAGDVNGDGYGDVIVSAPVGQLPSTGGGAIVYYGGPAGLSESSTWVYNRHENGSDAGLATVSGGGDFNGDGYADVVLGLSSLVLGADTAQGAVLTFHGGPAGLPAAPSRIVTSGPALARFGVPATSPYASFARWVAAAGDVDGDGCSDLFVHAMFLVERVQVLTVFLYRGGREGISGEPAWWPGHFTYAACGAGDVNGDGRGDVLVTKLENYDDSGRVFAYHGRPARPRLRPFAESDEPVCDLSPDFPCSSSSRGGLLLLQLLLVSAVASAVLGRKVAAAL